jgi:hypothetical protein
MTVAIPVVAMAMPMTAATTAPAQTRVRTMPCPATGALRPVRTHAYGHPIPRVTYARRHSARRVRGFAAHRTG